MNILKEAEDENKRQIKVNLDIGGDGGDEEDSDEDDESYEGKQFLLFFNLLFFSFWFQDNFFQRITYSIPLNIPFHN